MKLISTLEINTFMMNYNKLKWNYEVKYILIPNKSLYKDSNINK